MNFTEERKVRVEKIEAILKSYLPDVTGAQKTVLEAMHYSVLAGGKRLRPMLMAETCRLFGDDGTLLPPFMAAIEMIHTYSLVHDDLPAMDNDEYRRGRKTTHAVYGEAMGILAGDGLLNYAFETAASAFDLCGGLAGQYEKCARALKVLANKAGVYGMIGGQTADVEATGKQVDGELLSFIFELKTGALIEASMVIGAILGGASEAQIDCIAQIAGKVGYAFQIEDDILDVTGDEKELGKPLHSDEKNDKSTYVTLYGLERAREDAAKLSHEAMDMLRTLDGSNPFLEALLESLICRTN